MQRGFFDECYVLAYFGTLFFFIYQMSVYFTAATSEDGTMRTVWRPTNFLISPFWWFLLLALVLTWVAVFQTIRSVRLKRWSDLCYYVPACGVFGYWVYIFLPFWKIMEYEAIPWDKIDSISGSGMMFW